MAERLEFREKLAGILTLCESQITSQTKPQSKLTSQKTIYQQNRWSLYLIIFFPRK